MTVSPLTGKRIGVTAPQSYGEFLVKRLEQTGAIPVWAPSISVQRNPSTRTAIKEAIATSIASVAGIAFTSRNGIRAVAEVLPQTLPPLMDPFLLGALGRDAQLLETLTSLYQGAAIETVLPAIATPKALVEALGNGKGRSLLCPVPRVVGLTEPAVVPTFLRDLELANWNPIRVDAYETAWMGDRCAEQFLKGLDAWVITSTAEVEGLLKSLNAMEMDLTPWISNIVVAAHGPVTAAGAESLGVSIQVISQDSSSFQGVLEALESYWKSLAV